MAHSGTRGSTQWGLRCGKNYCRADVARPRLHPSHARQDHGPLKYQQFVVRDGLPRLVVEIEGLELDASLRELVSKVQPNDPYIALVRVGQNRPGFVRIVFDLKQDIAPQVFQLQPVGDYRNRLVFILPETLQKTHC